MREYIHYDGCALLQSEVEESVKERVKDIIDGDPAMHGIVYDVIDGKSTFSEAIDAAFDALEKARHKPELSMLNKAELLKQAADYASYFVAVRGMQIAQSGQ